MKAHNSTVKGVAMTTRKLDPTKLSDSASALSLKFSKNIIGQNKATDALVRVVQKFQSGFHDVTKPIASLLFLGPTGVGKTGTVEAFVEGMFGDVRAALRVDCAEFQHSHEIAKLVGSPPGYLGHRETHPYFTQEALNQWQSPELNFSIVAFDEIEKASDSLWNLLLGILDKASLTLGDNRRVDFSRTIIIMTSNVGAAELAAKAGDNCFGFLPLGAGVTSEKMEDIAMSAARRKFQPEFLNRLDNIVMFNTLTPENIDAILSIELEKLQSRVVIQSKKLFTINVSPAAYKQLLAEGYSKRDNARYLKRTVGKYVELPLSALLSTGQITHGDTVIVDYDGEWSYYAQGVGEVLFP